MECLVEGYANFKLLSLRVSAVHHFFYYLLLRGILLSWGRRIAIYNSRKRNYYSPRIENYHFSPDIFFTSIHACYSLVVHHFFVIKSHSRDLSNRYYLFFPLSKEGNSFARLLFSIKRRNRCIRAWNRKFPTYYFNPGFDISSSSFYTLEARKKKKKRKRKKRKKKYHACGIRQDLRCRLVCKSSSR